MDSSSNNIQLEIEMTNRERGNSIIRNDIERALDVPIERNRTLNEEEIQAIDKCNDTYDKYEWLIRSSVTILGLILCMGMLYLIGLGFLESLKLLINY
mgnify:CR=1 FL=1